MHSHPVVRGAPTGWLALLLPVALFAGLIIGRAWQVDALAGAYTGCVACLRGTVFHHDLTVLALFLLLRGAGCFGRIRVLGWLARLAQLALLLAWAADWAVFAALTQRLHIGDVLLFGHEGAALGEFAVALLHSSARSAWLATAAIWMLTIVSTAWPSRRTQRGGVALLISAAMVGALRMLPLAPAHYVHPEVYQNLFEVNRGSGINVAYSAAYTAQLAHDARPSTATCDATAASIRPNVVLVLVESLSAYHSHLLGGFMDATPKLDGLALANHYFVNFHANGFTTSGGRIALYTGRAPVPPPGYGRGAPLSAYAFRGNTLPELAHRAGYTAHYFTSGTLEFSDSAPWLHGLGFDSVEGAESPFYTGMKRWQFNAPEDHALFARFLDWLAHRNDPRPFVATLLTVSTHPPFIDPRTGHADELSDFRYVDEQLAWLHAELARRGFFKHGILLITGDHRSMTPLHAAELARWGDSAFSRVPMVVIGKVSMPRVVNGAYAQTDFPGSFAEVAGLPACHDAAHGLFLRADPVPAEYLLHASGQQSDHVEVIWGDGQHRAVYGLDGDDGGWQGDVPPNANAIKRAIDVQRIEEVGFLHRK